MEGFFFSETRHTHTLILKYWYNRVT